MNCPTANTEAAALPNFRKSRLEISVFGIISLSICGDKSTTPQLRLIIEAYLYAASLHARLSRIGTRRSGQKTIPSDRDSDSIDQEEQHYQGLRPWKLMGIPLSK
jgi:hypothetical protein